MLEALIQKISVYSQNNTPIKQYLISSTTDTANKGNIK